MATQTRTVLKTYFNTDDYPTEQQFADLIDSTLNLTDTPAEEVGAIVNGAAAATPTAADLVPFTVSSVIKKITWTNFLAAISSGIASLAATLTNKRVVPRMYTTVTIAGSPGSLTIDHTAYDYYEITAQDAPLFFANPTTTTLTGGEKIIVVTTCDATARAITKDTKFVEKGGILFPTTLVASKKTTFGFIYDKATDTFNLIGLAQEA